MEKIREIMIDMCCRIPYDTKVCYEHPKTYKDAVKELTYDTDIDELVKRYNGRCYLRPMSSMTQDEVNEYRRLKNLDWQNYYNKRVKAANKGYWLPEVVYNMSIDYLNSIHIDYRGLIEKGLALEALEGMYNIKEK